MWKSLDTTVSTPGKWPGRTAPSRSAPRTPGPADRAGAPARRALRAGAGGAGAHDGVGALRVHVRHPRQEHQLDALLAAGGQVGVQWTGVAREGLVWAGP